ncbi:MAG TPA: hypothetical protein VNI57_13415 [Candidatus Saccharimonadales bacterium]|nr:hypothetical protein [Candidatus Saccharimonadales bacterium]
MHWRLVGPFRGGWATAVSGVPGDPATWYFGAADGGVWKTTDAGVTWKPLFNDEGSASIGALAVATSDPNVLWVGTGQIQQRWDIVDGDGVYRSTDAGATWSHVGLEKTKHIGNVWVDPRDARVAVVAALGHVFGANPERGIYRTADGGKTWDHVVDKGPDVGAVDIAGDPAMPDVLFASLWQVRRHPWLDYFQPTVGPGSGIVKSTDGGKSWKPAGTKGFPAGPLGRIELAVSPGTSSRRVWAAVEAEKGGGLYRSDDGGESWTQVNDTSNLGSSYTCNLAPDPKNPDVIWAMGRSMRVSKDGGRHFTWAKGSPGGDDYHILWIDPADARRMITGADQGAALTLNGGETWSSWYNQPTGQFYRLAADHRFPYWMYSGQQDSGTVGIASRSDYGNITFRDWHPVGGDERDGDVPDPADPAIVYGAGLGGRLSKWDERTGQVQNVTPWPVMSYASRPGTTQYRYDWITPLAVSPRPPHAVYVGAQVLFRSLDGGDSWKTVSDDLTGTDPKAKDCDGDVPVERATACGFGTIFAISPSPAADGLVWVGTTNGRVMLTRDDSKSWKNVTPPGLADWTKVSHIDASERDPATAYVAADAHRKDDFSPVAFRTHDYGASWTEIGHGLPAGAWVGVVREDPARAGLLYAGTSRGVWVSFDDGESWQSLQLNLPTTGINDMRVHDDDLAVATEGRAIWILDQLAPLRNASGPVTSPVLIPPARAWRLRGNENKDTPLPPEEPRGENPPAGAVLDYVLPEGIAGPVTLSILDEDGSVIRRFSSAYQPEAPKAEVYFTDLYLGGRQKVSAAPGQHRLVWNLRYERPKALEYEYSIAAVPGQETEALPEGAFVLPGTYKVRLLAGGATVEQPLEVAMDPRVKTPAGELAELLEFQRRVADALARTADLETQRRKAEGLLDAAGKDPKAKPLADSIARQQEELKKLTAVRAEDPRRANGVLATMASDLESADAPPTGPQHEVLASREEGAASFEMKWKAFEDGGYRDLATKLAALGIRGKESGEK